MAGQDRKRGRRTAPSGVVRAGQLPDVEILKVLAHPARLAILRHLGSSGPATATECSSVTGLSVAACSFHLRELARAGLVEEDTEGATSDARRRPWRSVPRELRMSSREDDPEGAAQPEEIALVLTALQEDSDLAARRFVEREQSYPQEWRQAAGRDQMTVRVTPSELAQLRWAIGRLLEGVGSANTSGERRPVSVVLEFTPAFDPERRPRDGH